jgi:hypothetical protein
MTLLIKPIYDGSDVMGLGELTATDTAEIIGPLVVGSDSEFNSTGGIKIPVGTTANRPSSPKVGCIRFNSEFGLTEYWNGSVWVSGAPDYNAIIADLIARVEALEVKVAANHWPFLA